MRRLRFGFVCVLAIAGAALGCELIAGLQDRALCQDECVDAPAVTPNYTLSVSPVNIVIDPSGPSVPVAITLARVGGFSEAVAISLSNPPAGLSGSAIIPGNASTGTLNVFADKTAVEGQANLVTVEGQSTPSGVVASQPLTIRVGHVLLVATASTTFVVPGDVQNATIAAWGAGGGAGGTTTVGAVPGAPGGAGGFAEGTFPVTPGETLTVLVAAPGVPGGAASYVGYGGGGGGYSGVVLGDVLDAGVVDAAPGPGDAGASPFVLVAGGGAGGGGGFYYQPNPPANSGPGRPGGAGSGANGADGINPGGGKGGTTTAGGAGGASCGPSSSGGLLQGGNVGTKGSDAGVPGGGYGNTLGGGGGGGGFYGGGSGAGILVVACNGGGGGGGGGGHVDPSGTGITTAAGTGATAPGTAHKFYVSGVATGGTTDAGGPGRVVIYLQ